MSNIFLTTVCESMTMKEAHDRRIQLFMRYTDESFAKLFTYPKSTVQKEAAQFILANMEDFSEVASDFESGLRASSSVTRMRAIERLILYTLGLDVCLPEALTLEHWMTHGTPCIKGAILDQLARETPVPNLVASATVMECLLDPNDNVQRCAARLLQKMCLSDEEILRVRSMMREGTGTLLQAHPNLAIHTMTVLAQHNQSDQVAQCLADLKTNGRMHEVALIVHGLKLLSFVEEHQELVGGFLDPSVDPRIIVAALEAVRVFTCPDDAFDRIRSHQDESVGVAVCKAIERSATPSSPQRLESLAKDGRWRVRLEAVRCMAKLKGHTFEAGPLVDLLVDPFPVVRTAAAVAMGVVDLKGTEGLGERMSELLAEEFDDSVKNEIERAMLIHKIPISRVAPTPVSSLKKGGQYG